MSIHREQQKRQVQQATDIVRLIGEHVALRPRGKEFLGLCPFHDDKNPSMHVAPAKQIYKCFSCGAGGDVFSFMMNYHKMTFPEALANLADRAGIDLVHEGPRGWGSGGSGGQGASSEGEDGPTDRDRIFDANKRAIEFFRALLRHPEHGRTARQYIEKRGISAEMVEQFQIGYAPDRWDGLVMIIREKAWDARGFELAGLISPRRNDAGVGSRVSGFAEQDASRNAPHDTLNPTPESRSFYDRLRHRLIFPICDALGRPIAFGGRKLREEDEPKYLNSPETLLFNKSATLFGLHLAKKPIIDSRTVVIVEGYTDVIACHQAGVRNVVATLGTALTSQHASVLRRFAEKIVLIFDADEAGHKASDRAVEVLLTEDLDVHVAVLPDGLDPAELFERPDGVEHWRRAVDGSVDMLEYQFDRLREKFDAAGTMMGRQRVVEAYLSKLAALGLGRSGVIRRAMIVSRLSELLHLSEAVIDGMIKRLAPAGPRSQASPALSQTASPVAAAAPLAEQPENQGDSIAASASASKIKALRLVERQLVGGLLRRPELFHEALPDGRTLDEALTPADLFTEQGRALYSLLYDRLAEMNEGSPVTLASLVADLAGRQELIDAVTSAEVQVEQSTLGQESRVRELVLAAAVCILNEHREADYHQARQALTNPGVAEPDAKLLKMIAEHRRANPSPVRIARLGGA